MKKVIIGVLIFIFGNSLILHAQFDETFKKVLDKVSANYQSYNTLKADVLLSIEGHQEEMRLEKGNLVMERASGKFKINLGGHEIINNGKTQWTVLKEQNEIQVTEAEHDGNSLTPATIFTFYKKGYKGTFIGVTKEGDRILDVIKLIPHDAGQNILKIELRVDRKSNLIYDAIIFDKNGGKITYTFNRLQVNELIPYTTFVFNISDYPSMEIVDLR